MNDKNKTVAGVLALLLGDIGIHKFYLGQTGKGILYILFCWTFIPALLALIEGVQILCMSDEKFQENILLISNVLLGQVKLAPI